MAKSNGNPIFFIYPLETFSAPSLLPPLKWLLEGLYSCVPGKRPLFQASSPISFLLSLGLHQYLFEKGWREVFLFFFWTPCMFENSLVLFSCLIKFSWTQNSRLKISPSPISAVPWRQLLHCFQASDIAVETSGAVLLPDLRMGLLCLLSGRCESSLCPQYLGVSLWDASLCGSPRPYFAGHSEGLFYLEADLQYWEIFKIPFSIILSIFFSS